jgi:hypothetical protein
VADKKRFEPWPIALAGALLFMIGVSLAFFWVALTHPDPVLVRDDPPGVER